MNIISQSDQYEPQRWTMYLQKCANNEDSNHSAHPRWPHKENCILGYPKCAHWRLWSYCAFAKYYQNLRWAHMSAGTFHDVSVHVISCCIICPIIINFKEWPYLPEMSYFTTSYPPCSKMRTNPFTTLWCVKKLLDEWQMIQYRFLTRFSGSTLFALVCLSEHSGWIRYLLSAKSCKYQWCDFIRVASSSLTFTILWAFS